MATVKTSKRLRDRQLERFCREYVDNGFNGTKAARAAGKSGQWASTWACEQLKKPEVIDRCTRMLDDILTSLVMSKEEVVAEMNKLATFDARAAYDEDGRLIPVHEMDGETAAAIQEVEYDARGNVVKVKFLNSKRAALQDMMKYYNAFEDHQKSGAGEMHVHLDAKDAQA